MRGRPEGNLEEHGQSESCIISEIFVIPAKAGTQGSRLLAFALDPRFRGGDG